MSPAEARLEGFMRSPQISEGTKTLSRSPWRDNSLRSSPPKKGGTSAAPSYCTAFAAPGTLPPERTGRERLRRVSR